jgi:hypothetical protein
VLKEVAVIWDNEPTETPPPLTATLVLEFTRITSVAQPPPSAKSGKNAVRPDVAVTALPSGRGVIKNSERSFMNVRTTVTAIGSADV